MAKIYISSTFRDLRSFRKTVDRALRRIQQNIVAMEYYVSENKRPLDKCLEDVRNCDFYVGIFAWRYGFVPKDKQQSITELEYREAKNSNKECLIFLSTESDNWEKDTLPDGSVDVESLQKITQLRNELMLEYSLGGEFFQTEYQLATNVVISLFDNSKLRKDKLPNTFAYYCDRIDQNTEFMSQYQNSKITPPIFIVEGENDQSHHGLVLRFAYKKFKIPEDQIVTVFVQHSYRDTEYKKFLSEINRSLGIASEEFDGQMFMDRFKNIENHHIFLVFKVHQSYWNKAIVKNINTIYDKICRLIEPDTNFTKIHFFVNVVYESIRHLSIINKFRNNLSKRSTRADFKLLKRSIHLPELNNVGNLDLRYWLDQYLTENAAVQQKLHDRYDLPVTSKYPMSEIELFLTKIISDYNSKPKVLKELGLNVSP